jgi:peptidoglycan/LPS O-acetylase OafA/YrhL
MTPVVPARPLLVAIVLAALAGGGIVAAVELASDHQTVRAVWAIFAPAVGWSFIGTGLYAWRRRPESRIGALMILLGFAWFVYSLQAANSTRARSSSAACGAPSSCTSG